MKKWKKWLLRAGLLGVVVPAVFVWADRHETRSAGEARLAAVTAELDATDSGWRLGDLLAAREAKFPPDDRNPMAVVHRICPKEPAEYKEWVDRRPPHTETDQNRLLGPKASADAARVRAACLGVIEPARGLRLLAEPGGYKLNVSPNPLDTSLQRTQNLRSVVGLLALDAEAFAVEGQADRAVEITHAALNAARGLGDEPFLISMLVRIACDTVAVRTAGRVLGLSEPKAGLADLQAAFAVEAETPFLRIGLRGDRAMFDRLFANLDVGLTDLNAVSGQKSGSFDPVGAAGWWVYRGYLPGDRARFLETMNRLIEITKKPAPERTSLFDQWEAEFRAEIRPNSSPDRRYILTCLLMPAAGKVGVAELRVMALMRSAAAGIACERFRQANGRWPKDLAEIPKTILPAVPADPYDGQPLRVRRTENGVVVYAVGPDLADNEGELAGTGVPGTDIGFRLWDPAHRRAAPLPEPGPDDAP